jgi:superfamily II DNA or RNA helicase
VVAADADHARRIARALRDATGRPPVVVLHAEPRSAAKLVEFTVSREPWIVAVNMVSEGVDIPRLRVGVYATAAKTALVFRQIVGRFVRTIPGRAAEPSWLYVPADPVLREHAAAVEDDVRTARRRDGEPPDSEFERLPRRDTERSDPVIFEPLSADVAPQLTLFGPPAAAPVRVGAPAPTAGPAEMAVAPPPARRSAPAFERRARLRSERHRLVSDLTRRDGTSQREINAWLNRAVGISSVEQATLAELERAVELLERRLSPLR